MLKSSFLIEENMSKKSKRIISYDNGDFKRTCLYGYSIKKENDTFRSLGSNIINY